MFFWFIELGEAQYHPCYSKRDLGPLYQNELKVSVLTQGGEKLSGYLTNWSIKGCFITFNEDIPKIKGKVALELLSDPP